MDTKWLEQAIAGLVGETRKYTMIYHDEFTGYVRQIGPVSACSADHALDKFRAIWDVCEEGRAVERPFPAWVWISPVGKAHD